MCFLNIVVIFVVSGFGGECINPTCSFGDEATCASTTGCGWSSGESGYCSGPSCSSASSENACTANTNCVWKSTGSSCSRPTSQECRALTETSCNAANSGCRWVAESGQCSGPTSKQCRAMSQTECQSEESGCSWSKGMVVEDRCVYNNEKCQGLSPTACDDKSGCVWQPGNCTYTGCGGLAENACKADNNCYYSPPRGSCRAPQSNSCSNLNPTTCGMTPGCHFTPDYSQCMPSNPSVTSCSSTWDGTKYVCGEGCTMKVVYAGACEANYVDCYDNADYTGCTSSSVSRGCIWSPISSVGICALDYGCEDILSESDCNGNCQFIQPRGSCIDHPQKENCNTLSLDDCDNTEYCYVSGEVYSCSSSDPDVTTCQAVYRYDSDDYVCYEPYGSTSCFLTRTGVCKGKENSCGNYNYDYASCSAGNGCIWDGTGGACHHWWWDTAVETPADSGDDDSSGRQRRLGDPLSVCSNNAEITACSSDSPAGCSFSGGYCSAVYVPCEKAGSGNDCSQASKDVGCVWKVGNATTYPGDCSSVYRPKCYKDAAGTACDSSSSLSFCSFKSSAGRCEVDNNLVCGVKADGSGCNTVSAASGCKWIADGGICYNAQTCYKNSDGDGCDTTNGATGCIWQPATSGVCKQSGTCAVNATGDGCTDASLVAGCVWDKRSAASVVHVPIFLLLVLLLFNL